MPSIISVSSSSNSSTNWTLSIISAHSSVTGSNSVCLDKLRVRFKCPELYQFTHLNKFSSLSNCFSSSSSDSWGSSFSMFTKQLSFSKSRRFMSCVCNNSSDIFLGMSYICRTWENIRRCNEQVSCVLSLQQYLQSAILTIPS